MQTGFWAGFSVIHFINRLFVKPWNLSQVVEAKGRVWDRFKARRDIENKPLICHLTNNSVVEFEVYYLKKSKQGK